jgi:hypothetical protein
MFEVTRESISNSKYGDWKALDTKENCERTISD